MDDFHSHWLVRAALKAGLRGAGATRLHARTPPPEAWTIVARACRLADAELALRLAPQVGMRAARFDEGHAALSALLPETVARQLRVVPLRTEEHRLVVATSDPADSEALRIVTFCTGRGASFELAAPSQVEAAIEAIYSPERVAEHLLTVERSELAEAIRFVQSAERESSSSPEVDAAPIVRLTNLILHEAISAGASDVHIEPESPGGLVRFRIDGVMQDYVFLPRPLLDPLVFRLKVMGAMDVSDRLRPQSGRSEIELRGTVHDLRISTVPTRNTEKAVVRLLRPGRSQRLRDLDMPEAELGRLRKLLSHRDGLVVVTGPTGSGKTTTLYGALRELATGQINVMTVEDPVEYAFPGATQIQVMPRHGLTFASALRTVLRQDPDVILVGEIRDLETAEIALQASMTGHLVLTSLHTADAASVVTRLVGLGLNRANVASSLRGVIAQRLVRRLCPECRGAGCSACRGTGYRGRVPIMETFLATPQIEQAITDGASPLALQRVLRDGGMTSLRAAAMNRIRAGETNLEEVERVLGEAQQTEGGEPAALIPHLLLVASDAGLRAAARGLLERDGWRVSEAASGAAALQRVEERSDHALVLIDSEMAGMEGSQLLARLKGAPRTVGLPVAMLVPANSENAEHHLLEQGAIDCIRKPVEAATFTAQVRGCMRRVGVAEPAPPPPSRLEALLEARWPSIAVLPFTDKSPERDQSYLCEGLAEELIGALSRLDGLRVASRNSSFRASAADLALKDLGRQLGVDTVLEGTTQKAGNRLRISAHLVNVEDGYELWSDRYVCEFEDVFKLQDDISRSIVAKLSVVLLGPKSQPLVERGTGRTEAYELYLKGRYQWNRRTEDSLARAIDLFKDAVRHDPDYALAHAGLADAYLTLAVYGAIVPVDAMPAAQRAAERAFGLDAKSAEALCAAASVRTLYLWDWDAATDFRQALALDPHQAQGHHWYAAHYLLPLGRFEEARQHALVAAQFDPLSPAIHATIGVISYFERRFEEAIAHLQKTREMDPAFGLAPYFIGQACTQLGRHAEALGALHLAGTLSAGSPEVRAALACAHAAAGDEAAARRGLAELVDLSGVRYVSPVLIAEVALRLADRATALQCLQRAVELRATDLVWLNIRPGFDSLRAEPRFIELASRVLPMH